MNAKENNKQILLAKQPCQGAQNWTMVMIITFSNNLAM